MNKKSKRKGRSKSAPPKKSNDQGRALRLLVGCIVVLVVGLALRMYWSNQEQAKLRDLKSRVISAQKVGDWPAVEEAAREWATLQPDEYEPWGYASAAAEQLGDVGLAIDYLVRMPDSAPVEAYHKLGLMQMEQAIQPQESYETCLRTLQTYPEDTETHTRLLYYYTMTCQREKLRDEIRRVIELGCDTSVTYVYLFTGDWLTFTNGYTTNKLWLERDPGNELYDVAATIHLFTRQVDDEGNRKETAEDLQEYENALFEQRERYPENIELLAAELELRCENGDLEIVEELQAATPEETLAKDHRFRRFEGWRQSALGQWEASREAYMQGLAIEPFDWDIQTELELVLRRLNEPESAADIREVAEQGRRIARAIQVAPNLFDVPAETLEDLADYYAACGMETESKRLRALIL